MDAPRRVTRPAMLAAVVAAGCGPTFRGVPLGPHEGAATPVEVDSAPPPAKIEAQAPRSDSRCAWLDGRWEWRASAWRWTAGSWVAPREGCHFALPEALWVPSAGRGQLFYLPGRWYRDGGGPLSCEPDACR